MSLAWSVLASSGSGYRKRTLATLLDLRRAPPPPKVLAAIFHDLLETVPPASGTVELSPDDVCIDRTGWPEIMRADRAIADVGSIARLAARVLQRPAPESADRAEVARWLIAELGPRGRLAEVRAYLDAMDAELEALAREAASAKKEPPPFPPIVASSDRPATHPLAVEPAPPPREPAYARIVIRHSTPTARPGSVTAAPAARQSARPRANSRLMLNNERPLARLFGLFFFIGAMTLIVWLLSTRAS